MSKPKKITFLWQNMENNTMNTLEWETSHFSIEGAWETAEMFLIDRNPSPDPKLVMVFDGLVKVLDESTPLRQPTLDELKKEHFES